MGEYSWAKSDEYDNLSNKLFLDSFYTGLIFLSNDISGILLPGYS